MSGDERRWMDMDGDGWRWIKMHGGGRRCGDAIRLVEMDMEGAGDARKG